MYLVFVFNSVGRDSAVEPPLLLIPAEDTPEATAVLQGHISRVKERIRDLGSHSEAVSKFNGGSPG